MTVDSKHLKPTLLILAAGVGSRCGGLKQMDPVGPNNELIIDYSIYDAIKAGFGKVVFVIRHSFEQAFKEKIETVASLQSSLLSCFSFFTVSAPM